MGNSKSESSNKELWGCIGAIGAATVAGIIALIIASPTLVPFFLGLVSTQTLVAIAPTNTLPAVPTTAPAKATEALPAQITESPTLAIASTASSTRFNSVSLQSVGKFESGNLGLQAGVTTLAGVDFEIGWLATTQSTGDSNSSDKIVLSVQSISDPSKVHFLFQGSWAVNSGQEFGNIYIAFADGHTINEPLIAGYTSRGHKLRFCKQLKTQGQ